MFKLRSLIRNERNHSTILLGIINVLNFSFVEDFINWHCPNKIYALVIIIDANTNESASNVNKVFIDVMVHTCRSDQIKIKASLNHFS